MSKFFKKSKKPYFGAILGLFCPYLGKNEFSWKKVLCQFLNIPIVYYHTKNQKKLITDSWEKCRQTDRWTENSDFIGPSPVGDYMFKVNNRNTRTRCETCSMLTLQTPKRQLASLWCLYCWLWTYFTPWSSISIVNFEHESAGWVRSTSVQNIATSMASIVKCYFNNFGLS